MDAVGRVLEEYAEVHYGWGCVVGILCFATYLWINRESITRLVIAKGMIFSIYIVVLLGGTLLNRIPGKEYGVVLTPFWSYYETFVEGKIYLKEQMLYNVIVFLPWGIMLPIWFEKIKNLKTVLCSTMIFSVLIESLQWIFRCGTCEFDDVFHNVLGAAFGYGILKLISIVRGKVCTREDISFK